jgi:hypothetical protein
MAHGCGMKESKDRDEKAVRKFDSELLEFGFDGDMEFSNAAYKEFSQHTKKVVRERQRLDAD